MELYDLRTEDLKTPIGIDIARPAFSWKMKSDKKGAKQTAYSIIVRDENNEVWNSGKVMSDKSVYIEYDGAPLRSETRYFWSVTVWDGDDFTQSSSWFETGLDLTGGRFSCRMGDEKNVWYGAEWIGSPKQGINTAAIDSYTVSGAFISDKLCLAVNARDRENCVLIEIESSSVHVYERSDDAWGEGEPYKKLLGEYACVTGERFSCHCNDRENRHSCHIFVLDVIRRNVTLRIDDETVINNECILPENPPDCPRKAYMMSIGFNQMETKAVIEHLKIESGGNVLQEDNFRDGIFSALGEYQNGSLVIENDFSLVCPVSGVNVRKLFESDGKIKSARLYASACGFYEAFINGKKVGDDFYNPGFTDYRLRIQYQTFDVTDMIKIGINSIGAVVGKGHYSGFCGYSGAMVYGKENSFIAKLVINYENGDRRVIVTDEDWQFTDKGALMDSDYFDGETYDARLEFDWNNAEDSRWVKCGIKEWSDDVVPTNGTLKDVKFMLSAQKGSTARVTKTLKGKFICEMPDGHYIYDMGENMVGTVRLTLKGNRGQTVRIRYGEMLCEGRVYVKNLRSAANTDIYTLRGENDVFIPSFTSHGFRYVEINGSADAISRDIIASVEGLVISNVYDVTGGFECSNPLVNRLYSNIINGQRGNSLLVLTDCPQRNERMGWTGDAQVFARTGAYNMDTKAFTDKWLTDLEDAQLMYNKNGAVPDTAPLGGDNRLDGCGGWGDAAVIVPWEMYNAYGDIRVLKNHYAMMKKWVDYQSREVRQNCGLRVVDGKEVPEQSDLASKPFIQVQQRRGDHLTYDASTPYIYSATAYAAHSADILSRAAKILGRIDDAEKYRRRFEDIKRAFNEAWVQNDGSVAYWGEVSKNTPHCGEAVALDGSVTRYTRYAENLPNKPSQTAYALAIDFDLIPSELLSETARYFKDSIERNQNKLSVGFLGISHLNTALSKAGLNETAFALLEQEENPSWLYSVKNGATTVWERWDSYIAETGEFGDVSMNSFNHYAYGSVGEWMMGNILGIKPLEAGYKRFILEPTMGGNFTYAKGYHESPYGRIESAWTKGNGKIVYECTVPPNTAALMRLPSGETHELESGKYKFVIKSPGSLARARSHIGI